MEITRRTNPAPEAKKPAPKRPLEYLTKRLTDACHERKFNLMVKHHPSRLDAIFQALADPTRRAMLGNLAKQSLSVGELAAPFDMSLAAASKHIKLLERAGLIQRSVQGRTHLCQLNAMPMHAGMEWMRHYESFWTQRLDALEALLQSEPATDGKPIAKTRRKR